MRMFANVLVAVALTCSMDGCCEKTKEQPCQINGDGELMCPSGKRCKYDPGDDPQDPTKYGKCEAYDESSTCKNVGPCAKPNKECGFNASFCDVQYGTFCHCDGPHLDPVSTGGESHLDPVPTGGEAKK